jgi:hypothetical protein
VSSTAIRATPDAPDTARTRVVSTPAERNRASNSTPNGSVPTAPMNAQTPPARAAATAWLAPLPPAITAKSRPTTVSPGRGSAGVLATRSMLTPPTTTIRVLPIPPWCRLAARSGGATDGRYGPATGTVNSGRLHLRTASANIDSLSTMDRLSYRGASG